MQSFFCFVIQAQAWDAVVRWLLFSAVEVVEVAVIICIKLIKLLLCYSERPIILAATWGIHTGIGTEEKQILNGKNNGVGACCKHRPYNCAIAIIPITSWVAEIINKAFSCSLIKLPYVAKQGIIIVRSGICHAVLTVSVGYMLGIIIT